MADAELQAAGLAVASVPRASNKLSSPMPDALQLPPLMENDGLPANLYVLKIHLSSWRQRFLDALSFPVLLDLMVAYSKKERPALEFIERTVALDGRQVLAGLVVGKTEELATLASQLGAGKPFKSVWRLILKMHKNSIDPNSAYKISPEYIKDTLDKIARCDLKAVIELPKLLGNYDLKRRMALPPTPAQDADYSDLALLRSDPDLFNSPSAPVLPVELVSEPGLEPELVSATSSSVVIDEPRHRNAKARSEPATAAGPAAAASGLKSTHTVASPPVLEPHNPSESAAMADVVPLDESRLTAHPPATEKLPSPHVSQGKNTTSQSSDFFDSLETLPFQARMAANSSISPPVTSSSEDNNETAKMPMRSIKDSIQPPMPAEFSPLPRSLSQRPRVLPSKFKTHSVYNPDAPPVESPAAALRRPNIVHADLTAKRSSSLAFETSGLSDQQETPIKRAKTQHLDSENFVEAETEAASDIGDVHHEGQELRHPGSVDSIQNAGGYVETAEQIAKERTAVFDYTESLESHHTVATHHASLSSISNSSSLVSSPFQEPSERDSVQPQTQELIIGADSNSGVSSPRPEVHAKSAGFAPAEVRIHGSSESESWSGVPKRPFAMLDKTLEQAHSQAAGPFVSALSPVTHSKSDESFGSEAELQAPTNPLSTDDQSDGFSTPFDHDGVSSPPSSEPACPETDKADWPPTSNMPPTIERGKSPRIVREAEKKFYDFLRQKGYIPTDSELAGDDDKEDPPRGVDRGESWATKTPKNGRPDARENTDMAGQRDSHSTKFKWRRADWRLLHNAIDYGPLRYEMLDSVLEPLVLYQIRCEKCLPLVRFSMLEIRLRAHILARLELIKRERERQCLPAKSNDPNDTNYYKIRQMIFGDPD